MRDIFGDEPLSDDGRWQAEFFAGLDNILHNLASETSTEESDEENYRDFNTGIEQPEDHYSWQAIISVPDKQTCDKVICALNHEVDAYFIHFDGSASIETFTYVSARRKDEVCAQVAAIVAPLGGTVHMRGTV